MNTVRRAGMIDGMTPPPSLHRPPRRPHGWAWAFAVSQCAVAVIWWQLGWQAGLPALLLSHAPFLWGTLVPDSALFSPVLARLPTADPVVWLTIDDGPSDDTLELLEVLDAAGAKATFFLVGERAAARPQLVREIVARGHEVGNHSATHPQAWFWALSPRRVREEIGRAQAVLQEITGTRPHWFRAVVGMANPFVASVLHEHGLARVAWSARGYDALERDPALALSRIEQQLHPGAIVLLHEGARHGRNVELVALLLQRLRALGYRTVLPSEFETHPEATESTPVGAA